MSVIIFLAMTGCAPSISPLYRDYDLREETGGDIRERIQAALADTRWRAVSAPTPHVVATDTVTLQRWGLYRVEVSLEVAPVGDRYVRVFVHPYRRYFTGARRKIPYFKRRLRRSILPELARAFEAQGLYAIGSAMERDRESRK
ncbi:MAG: hypothetical protein R3178_10835 [Rhodothermales bacterium]|nr:hypothetical protein [Rhodothermales bacterium]